MPQWWLLVELHLKIHCFLTLSTIYYSVTDYLHPTVWNLRMWQCSHLCCTHPHIQSFHPASSCQCHHHPTEILRCGGLKIINTQENLRFTWPDHVVIGLRHSGNIATIITNIKLKLSSILLHPNLCLLTVLCVDYLVPVVSIYGTSSKVIKSGLITANEPTQAKHTSKHLLPHYLPTYFLDT